MLNLLLTVPGIGTPFLQDPKAIAEGYTADRLAPLPGLYKALFGLEGEVGKSETAAEQATRTRVLAYNALNTKCSTYCARGYDHFVETDASKAKLFVRNPASHPACSRGLLAPTPHRRAPAYPPDMRSPSWVADSLGVTRRTRSSGSLP